MNTTLEIIRESVNLTPTEWCTAGLLVLLGVTAAYGYARGWWIHHCEQTYYNTRLAWETDAFAHGFTGLAAAFVLMVSAVLI